MVCVYRRNSFRVPRVAIEHRCKRLVVTISSAVVASVLFAFSCSVHSAQPSVAFQRTDIEIMLSHPWGIAWLPDGNALITERDGRLLHYEKGSITGEIRGLPAIKANGQGGLLDVTLHPQFAKNGWVYVSYAAKHPVNSNLSTTALARFRLRGLEVQSFSLLFIAQPWRPGGRHFGSRIAFDDAQHVFLTVGDRGKRELAQDLRTHMGKVIRLNDDGSVPSDNPFVNHQHADAAVYSYGHRNPQGMVWHDGHLWLHEHGPRGGDELNKIRPGTNYGWPIVSFGREYISNRLVGEGTQKTGIEPPIFQWTPSIAPSGMSIAPQSLMPRQRGVSFLLGSLKFGRLVQVTIDDRGVTERQFFNSNPLGRIRDISIGPDGFLYLLLDEHASPLIRLSW